MQTKMADEGEYSQFLAIHRGQLEVADIPVQFWKALHEKLKNEVSCFWFESKLRWTDKSIVKNCGNTWPAKFDLEIL